MKKEEKITKEQKMKGEIKELREINAKLVKDYNIKIDEIIEAERNFQNLKEINRINQEFFYQIRETKDQEIARLTEIIGWQIKPESVLKEKKDKIEFKIPGMLGGLNS